MSEKNYPWIVWHYMVPVHHEQWCHSAHFWCWALSPLLFSQFFLTGFLFSLFHCRKCSLLGNTDSNLRNLSAEMKCLISFVLYGMSCFLSCAKLCWHGISSFFFFFLWVIQYCNILLQLFAGCFCYNCPEEIHLGRKCHLVIYLFSRPFMNTLSSPSLIIDLWHTTVCLAPL